MSLCCLKVVEIKLDASPFSAKTATSLTMLPSKPSYSRSAHQMRGSRAGICCHVAVVVAWLTSVVLVGVFTPGGIAHATDARDDFISTVCNVQVRGCVTVACARACVYGRMFASSMVVTRLP